MVSTFATMLIVPALFVLLMKRAKNASPSIDPDDPASRHYDGGETHRHLVLRGDQLKVEPAMPHDDEIDDS